MVVEIRLFATLRNGRFKRQEMSLEEMATPRMIIELLEIDLDDVAILLVNGRDGQLDQPLVNEDRVSIFPPVGGG